MRVALWRPLAFGLLFVPLMGLSVAAQPPVGRPTVPPPTKTLTVEELEKLRADLAALSKDKAAALPEDPVGSERKQLRDELKELLKQINNLPAGSAPPRSQDPNPVPKGKGGSSGSDEGPAPDKLSAATNYFRSNDFQAALGVLQQINLGQLGAEDRAFAKYITGCCQRRLNNIPEALRLFREVSNPPDDEFLAGCALWQISLIRANQDLATQLEQLRARQKVK